MVVVVVVAAGRARTCSTLSTGHGHPVARSAGAKSGKLRRPPSMFGLKWGHLTFARPLIGPDRMA